MKNFLNYVADYKSHQSLALKMRKKRFALFLAMLETIPKPMTILDIGGTQLFWERMGFTDLSQTSITILNQELPVIRHPNFSGLVGDGTNLSSMPDKSFDVVFSNSVIEHVGDFNQQRSMAEEVQRVGHWYFLQTPNYYFPIEPHYLIPGFQWLPMKIKIWLHTHFDLGHMEKIEDPQEAKVQIEKIRLLKKAELKVLFPGANIYEEKVLGLTKSFIAYNKNFLDN